MAVHTPWKAPPRRPPAELEREEDHRLATLASEGDEAAFEAIFERHHRGLLTLSRHMLGSREEAEDALQHTFAAAYRQLTEHGPPEHMRAWLYATARNRCSSVLRARRELPHGDLPAATAWLPDEVERRNDLRDLLTDIQRLPEDQRVALVLAEIEDLDHAEISEVLGCRRDKVRSLVFQARTTLGGWREARATPCREVREELATARGPELRRAHLRRHLAVCTDCTAFREEVDQQRRRVALLLPPVPIAVAMKESIVEAAISGAAGGAGAAAGGAGGAAAEAAGGAAGGGAAAAAGGAAAGGGIATAVKVGAAALVLGGAGAAGLGTLGGGGEDNPATPPPQREREPAAEEPRRSEAASKPNRKHGGQSKANAEKRLRARQRAQSASAGERVKEPTAAAPRVNTSGSAPRAPSVQVPSAQTPSPQPPSPQVPSLPAPPAPPAPEAEAPIAPEPDPPPEEPAVEISVEPPVEAPVEPPVEPPDLP